MTDIVPRLRDGGVPPHNVFALRQEAADEIEKLRRENKWLYDQITAQKRTAAATAAYGDNRT